MQYGSNGLYGRFLYFSKNYVHVVHVPFYKYVFGELFCFFLLLLLSHTWVIVTQAPALKFL